MDYSKIYIELMERSFTRMVDGYAEKHHIVPVCMGGDNKSRNIAILTPEEHYLAHQLLVKIYPKNYKLVYACQAMTMDSNGRRGSRKLYGWLKRVYSQVRREDARSKSFGENNNFFGRHHSEETRKRWSEKRKGKHAGKESWNYGKVHTEETRKRMSAAKSGKNHPHYGRTGIRSVHSRKVLQYTKDNVLLKTFDSIRIAGNELGILPEGISNCCRNKTKTSGGFIWKYAAIISENL